MAVTSPSIQGVVAPNLTIDPQNFYRNTRRMRFPMSPDKAIAGLGSTDTVQLIQTGIVSALEIRVHGSLTFGGTIGTTTMSYDWPYNLLQNITLSANGQSNLISCRGLTVKALNFIGNNRLDDNGVSKTFGGAVVTTGTLSTPADLWGTSGGNVTAPGSNVAAIGTFPFDFTMIVPVASEQVTLIGSIFAQSSATNLTLNVTWATQNQIVSALGGAATFASSINWECTGVAYTIPNVGGKFLIPDLRMFHQVSENRFGGAVQGQNLYQLPGTGVGRQLLRTLFQNVSNGTPTAVTDANYSNVSWAYGGNTVPESYPGGSQMRAMNIDVSGVDLGGNWGLALWDFVSINALRDTVDEAQTTNLRVQATLVNAPTAGYAQVAQEVLFAAATGA